MDRSFLRHAAVYGLANVLVQAGSFVLLPIYLRCLTPGDFGILEVTGRLAETVGTVLLFGGFRQALYTFYQQASDGRERREVVTATFALVVAAAVLGVLATLTLGPVLSGWIAPPADGGPTLTIPLLYLAILGILLEPLSLIPLTLIQARVESGTYVLIVVAQFLVRVGLCIFLVRFLGWGVAGALLATALSGALFGIVLTMRELTGGLAWPTLARLQALVAFALPLLPGGLCFFVLHHGDRFFLLRHGSVAEVGTYALGYKLAMVVRLLSIVPLYMVWSSRMYEVARTAEAPRVFGVVFTRILAAYLFCGLALCLFSPEVVLILGGSAYLDAAALVAPVVLACFFQAATSLMDGGFYICRRMTTKLSVTVLSTGVMLALYAVLIPRWGSWGAALATLGGFGFLALATYLATQPIFPVRYEWSRLLGLLALAVAAWMLGRQLPTGPWGAGVKGLIVLLVPATAWLSGLVSDEEKRLVLAVAVRLRTRLGRRTTPADESAGAAATTG